MENPMDDVVAPVAEVGPTTPDDKYRDSNVPRLVNYVRWAGEHRTLTVRPVDGDGEIAVPYLSWNRADDGRLTLILDNRLGYDCPAMTEYAEDSLIEFIANCLAVGAGYASIYYTKRKMPFRG